MLDAMMGMGKTTAMIRHINECSPQKRFIFCTPLLEQVKRVRLECPRRNFITPDDTFVTKAEDIKTLIKAGLNIATTHALFLRFDDETRELIRGKDYTLIVDEAIDALSIYDITEFDAATIISDYCETMENGQLVWTETDYDGRFNDYKQDIETETLYRYGNKTMIRMCKIESFEVFSEVYLMTYLFSGHPSKAYFDFNGWNYKQWYVSGKTHETYRLSEQPVKYNIPDYSKLITIKRHFNGSGLKTGKSSFSKKWYRDNSNPETYELTMLKRHMATFFRQNGGDGYDRNMWTTFKDYRDIMSGPRYAKGFIPCNSKATNEFRHKNVLAYPINRYLNPNLVNFISAQGGKLKHNDFALTEMVQWVWRSAIRDNQPITIYIPSDRMYKLFTNWLNSLH